MSSPMLVRERVEHRSRLVQRTRSEMEQSTRDWRGLTPDVGLRERDPMDKCKGCGAPRDPSRISCAFCGAVERSGLGEAEEFRALEELRVLLERTPAERLPSVWQAAYVPRHWGPAAQAFGQALQCVRDLGPASRAACSRAGAILTGAAVMHLANPAAAEAIPLMKEGLARAHAVAYPAAPEPFRRFGRAPRLLPGVFRFVLRLLAVVFGFVLLLLLLLSLLGFGALGHLKALQLGSSAPIRGR